MTGTETSLEEPRIEALSRYGAADRLHDPALDDIARLAAQLCNAPVAMVTLLDRDAIRIPGRFGIGVATAPRGSLPCETTVAAEGVYQIPDVRRDPEFGPAGLRLDGHRYRFYAGAPVLTPYSVAIGSLSVMDTSPRKLTPSQIESLEALSHMVTTRLELVLRVRETDRAARARHHVEGALTVERNFVSAVLDTVGALVLVCDTAGRIVRFNRACEIISGYHSSDIVGRFAWERVIPSEDVPRSVERFERLRAGDFPIAYENHWMAADGSRHRISWSATALIDANGQVAFVIATGIDVTAQRVAELSIRESEARYRHIVEGSLGLVATHDMEGRILSINQYGAEGVGRAVGDVVGHDIAELIVPGRRAALPQYLDKLLKAGEAQGLLRLTHANGEERVFAYRNRLVEPVDGPRYVLAFAVDISEQIRAEEQLRALIRQSNSVLEAVGDGIYGLDLEGRVTVVNPAAAQMLGYRAEELLGRKMHELIQHTRADGSPYAVADSPIDQSLRNRTAVRVSDEVFWRKDGNSFPVEYVVRPQIEAETDDPALLKQRAPLTTPLEQAPSAPGAESSEASSDSGLRRSVSPPFPIARIDEAAATSTTPEVITGGVQQGRAVGAVVAFTDISERNALDRMKDEFISTVSHELRTPLTSLRAALGLVAGGALTTRPEKLRQMMDIAIGNTDRLSALVSDILDLERMGSGQAELRSVMCSADELMRRCTGLLHATAARANIRFVIEANSVQVYADPDRILQTLTNLISNAIKFSPAPSTLPSEIRLTAQYVTEEEALIEVQDHGRGIPEDKLQEIFERFRQVDASDSRAKGGTGLGLAICRSIVQQHGGAIWVTSTLGKGSTFHFTLPTRPPQPLG